MKKIFGIHDLLIDVKAVLEILFLKFFPAKDKALYKYQITLTAVMRDEAPYLLEWIEFYRMLGVEHFYIYDNKSVDETFNILKPYIKNRIITYTYVDCENYPQGQCYIDAVFKHRNKCKYMMFVDVDEFVYFKYDNLLDYLNNFFSSKTDIGGLGINWLCFGSSGNEKKPDGFVIESYLMRSTFDYEGNKHIKSITNPRKIIRGGAHRPIYRNGYYEYNEDGEKIEGNFNPGCKYNSIYVHHYAAKSIEEQQARINRTFGKFNIKHNFRDVNDVRDENMLKQAKQLHTRI